MSDINYQVEYVKQRRERLESVIEDYFSVFPVSPQKVYDDLLDILEDRIKYHYNELGKANELYNLVLANTQRVGEIDSPGLTH